MTKIKICGLTRKEDIEAVNRYLPDYVGFVFTKSKRQVTLIEAQMLTQQLNNAIMSVGVFVDAPLKDVGEAVNLCGLHVVQLHGNEDADYINRLKKILQLDTQIIKVIKVKDTESVNSVLQIDCDYFLFDTFCETMTGGSGNTFNWEVLQGLDIPKPYFLAGGLCADNIVDAVTTAHPFAVDISSGVETSGVKNAEKIKDIIDKIRNKKI